MISTFTARADDNQGGVEPDPDTGDFQSMNVISRTDSKSYKYDPEFYQYINDGSRRSAGAVTAILGKVLKIRSVVDFGCGQGAWLEVWKKIGVEEVIGLDGDYVDPNSLLIDVSEFRSADLSRTIDLKRKFDLVQSLEVAEHLPEESAATFVDSLVRHGSVVMFSAAVPGQGGEHHINEQPYEYWRNLFSEKNYVLLDYVRPLIRANKSIEPWYRYNIFLFVERSYLANVPEEMRASIHDERASIPDISPILYKLRKLVLRQCPPALLSIGAKIKKKRASLKHKSAE